MILNIQQIKRYAGWMVLLILSTAQGMAQSCDYVTGPVRLRASGGNQTDLYSTTYVLTDVRGRILQINENEPFFQIAEEGFYSAYSLNIKSDGFLTGVEIGAYLDQVNPIGCYAISGAFGFTVCSQAIDNCKYCLGEDVALTSTGGTTDPAFTTQYILAQNDGTIISISDDPTFTEVAIGSYVAYAIVYETAKTIIGLEEGRNIANIKSGCLEWSDPYTFSVCDQLDPQIRMELGACAIGSQITLTVTETFDSYSWSNGSTDRSITVPADQVETYTVTVSSGNGCQGVAASDITGQEIVSIGDFVWDDVNNNGRQENDELGINDVTVNLYQDFDLDGIPDLNIPICTTVTSVNPNDPDEDGYYNFSVVPGGYIVEIVFPDGFTSTEQDQGGDGLDSDIDTDGRTGAIEVTLGQSLTNVDAGLRTSANICGSVWLDADGDGRRDTDEVGANDILLVLYREDGTVTDSVVTATDGDGLDGAYCFDNIGVTDYYVEIVLPDGTVVSPPDVSFDESLDSDATGANGPNTTNLITTRAGRTSTDAADFGFYVGGVVCGLVFQDSVIARGQGEEGIYEPTIDNVIANSQVELIDIDTDEVVAIAITDDQGRYCINEIPVGSYRVRFRAQSDDDAYAPQYIGNDPLIDSDVDVERSGLTDVFFIGAGEDLQGINAGLRMGVLPVELLTFEVYRDLGTGHHVLSWATAVEISNDRWEIERVIDNGDFEMIGTVDGAGTTSSPTYYDFDDTDVSQSGTYYYRLKQIDDNGNSAYSHIIALQVILNDEVASNVHPNPSDSKTQVNILVSARDQASVWVSDIMGRTVKSLNPVPVYKGKNVVPMDVSDLPNGPYIVHVKVGTSITYNRIQVAR